MTKPEDRILDWVDNPAKIELEPSEVSFWQRVVVEALRPDEEGVGIADAMAAADYLVVGLRRRRPKEPTTVEVPFR